MGCCTVPTLGVKLDEGAIMPIKSHPTDAGIDICSYTKKRLCPGEIFKFSTGVYLDIPSGYEVQVRSRSGCAAKGLVLANGVGTIDSGYMGEVGLMMVNIGNDPITVTKGDRIAQLVFAKLQSFDVVQVTHIMATDRGHCGFGSTGL